MLDVIIHEVDDNLGKVLGLYRLDVVASLPEQITCDLNCLSELVSRLDLVSTPHFVQQNDTVAKYFIVFLCWIVESAHNVEQCRCGIVHQVVGLSLDPCLD